MEKWNTPKKPRIGIYTMGLKAYWNQFPGLRERLLHYGQFIAEKIAEMDAEVFFYGLADCEEAGESCGEFFNAKNVDLIFAHAGTYVNSSSVLPIHQICKAPVIILNLQPTARIAYDRTPTGEWLAHCGACPVPELSNAFHRSGISCRIINGLLGLDHTPDISLTDENTAARPEAVRAWKEISEWVKAASVKRELSGCRFGFLGNTYNGMLDMYSDFTMVQAQTGAHIEILEMCDLDRMLRQVTEDEVEKRKLKSGNFSSSVMIRPPIRWRRGRQRNSWTGPQGWRPPRNGW